MSIPAWIKSRIVCIDQFDAGIVLAQNIESIPSTTTVAFAVDFNSIVDKKLNNVIQIFSRVMSSQNMKSVPSVVVDAIDIDPGLNQNSNDVNYINILIIFTHAMQSRTFHPWPFWFLKLTSIPWSISSRIKSITFPLDWLIHKKNRAFHPSLSWQWISTPLSMKIRAISNKFSFG